MGHNRLRTPLKAGSTHSRPEAPMLQVPSQHFAGGLIVRWSEPAGNGGTPISSYDLRYIRSDATDKTDSAWTERTRIWTSGELVYQLNGLEAQTQ